MINRYVNLSVFKNANDGYSINSPMGYYNLYNDLAFHSDLLDDTTYYLSGSRNSWDLCSWDAVNGELSCILGIIKTFNVPLRTIYFKSYTGEPWKFQMFGDEKIRFDIGSTTNNTTLKVVFQNGMFESNTNSVSFIKIANMNANVQVQFDSVLIKSKSIIFPLINSINVLGSSMVANSLALNTSQNVNFANSILGITDIYSDIPANSIKHINVDNVVFSQVVGSETLNAYGNLIINGQYQHMWEIPNILRQHISAYNTQTLSYLSSAFNTITISGNTSSIYRSEEPWDGKRDGVGFLYFNNLNPNVARLSSTSGYIPATATLNFNNQFTSASKISVDWFDGSDAQYFTSGTSATHIYQTVGQYDLAIRNYSKNNWYNKYDFCVETFDAYYIETISANLVVLDSFGIPISGTTYDNNTYTFSATNVIGHPSNYTFKLLKYNSGNHVYDVINSETVENSNSFNITSISSKYFFDVLKNADVVTLDLNVGLGNHFYTSAALNIQYRYLYDEYYVDLNSVVAGSGTSGNPFNFTQMKEIVKYQGVGNVNDTYFLKGNITLVRPDNESRPWYALSTDNRKNFVFDVWNAELNGPWAISIVDDYLDNNTILNMPGCTIKNGIIYNQPYQRIPNYYGGSINITKALNMWIVCQGIGSIINLVDTNNYVNIYGCTIYSENGFNFVPNNNSATSTYLTVADNVINSNNFRNLENSHANLFSNNCFGESLSSSPISASRINKTSNQFDWTIPEVWPFKIGNRNYGKDVVWIDNHKNDFIPFSNILEPPNPGYGYSYYYLYEYDLFGNLRNLYYRE